MGKQRGYEGLRKKREEGGTLLFFDTIWHDMRGLTV